MAVFGAFFLPVDSTSFYVAIAGFGVTGFGMGWNIPLWFSLSGHGLRGFSVIETSAIVMTASNKFYFLGPMLLGKIATACGNTAYVFGVEIVLTVWMAVCAYYLPRHYFELNNKGKLSVCFKRIHSCLGKT
jgi:hypothetical protein